jgi:hypothetical protein
MALTVHVAVAVVVVVVLVLVGGAVALAGGKGADVSPLELTTVTTAVPPTTPLLHPPTPQ